MSSDPELDPALRDVAVPDGLVARIKSSLGPTDDALDAALAQVVLPVGLVRDLLAIPDDERIADRLNDLLAPFELVHRARRQPWTRGIRRALSRAGGLAAALSLFLVVGGTLLGAIVVWVGSIYPQAQPLDEPAFVIAASLPLEFQSRRADDEQAIGPLFVSHADDSIRVPDRPPRDLAREGLEVETPELDSVAATGPVGDFLAISADGPQLIDSLFLLQFAPFGYPQYDEEVSPPLVSPPAPMAAGFELPPVRGYDRLFVVRHGVFPPVKPAAHPALATIALPLQTRSTTAESLQTLVRQDRWPSPSQVRTEDFLAAMDYEFPPAAPGEVAIRTAAGPSLFGPAGTGLLQLAAIAGPLAPDDAGGGHLVIALDMSQTMARGNRLALVRQSIDPLLAHLGPHDRLSLVLFDEAVRAKVERASAADAAEIRRLLSELRPAGATDLAEGLHQGIAVAMTEEPGQARPSRLVLVTDSRALMPPHTQALVEAVLDAAAGAGVRMDVFDVGDHPDEDAILSAWARRMHGKLYRPQSAADAAWLLVERLYGRSAIVGADVKLTLALDPRTVAAYRLIGQEGNALSSLRPAAVSVDLRSQEAATALLEVWFQPNDLDDVGEVELRWRDPSTGRERRRVQRISRLQFAATWEQAPLSLQQAAIAAETAEVLRGSRTALREIGLVPQGSGDLAGLLSTARRVHPQLAKRPDYRRWLGMLEDLSRMRP